MLHLTHSLPVNRANQTPINLEQLWSGLIWRVLEQTYFTVGLDRCDILAETATGYRRALSFGELVVRDTVTIIKDKSIEFVTDATDASPSGLLRISIDNNNDNNNNNNTDETLMLTFSYTTEFPEPSNEEESSFLEAIKAAYIAADEDMIRIIRKHALAVRH